MRGKISRIIILAKHFSRGLLNGAWWLIMLWIITIILFTWFVKWDGKVVVWCGIPQVPLSDAGSQNAMIRLLLSEYFCWGWVIVSFFYCLPNVLMPIAYSHTNSQVLWLRLTPTTPWEIAVGRVCRLLLASLLLGFFAFSWFLICAIYHEIEIGGFLLLICGFFAHLIASSGLVFLLSHWFSSGQSNFVFVVTSFMLPWISAIVYFVFKGQFGFWGDWWPYAMPFTYILGNDEKHLISSAMIGLLFIGIYISMCIRNSVLSNSRNRGF